MTDRNGAVFPSEERSHSTRLREPQQKNNAVLPPTRTRETELQPGSFVYDMRPMIQIQKLLGHMPFHMDGSGNNENENRNRCV
jgi:hypothetical protein